MTTKILDVIPTYSIDLAIKKDTKPMVTVHHTTKPMPITFQFACPLAMAEKLEVALECDMINAIHVKLITSEILLS